MKILCEDGWKDLKEYIICEDCGREYPEVWLVSDQMWKLITGITDGSGFLCMDCFDELAREQGIFLNWTCDLLQHEDK
jgi:hypothetical protein